MTTDGLDRIVDEHFARVRRAALVLTGNPWDADDLTQETFLVFSRSQDRFEGRSQVYTFLYGILLNLERRERRRAGVKRRWLSFLTNNGGGREKPSPKAETAIEVAEWKRSLWAHVAQLSDPQRQVLVLRFSESLPYEEIAKVMQCPLGTVKSRIHHALGALRLALSDDDARLAPLFPREDWNYALES